jgi:hypothetical protein
LALVLVAGVGIEENRRRENVDGRPRDMDGLGRPKWMKEIVNHEDEALICACMVSFLYRRNCQWTGLEKN